MRVAIVGSGLGGLSAASAVQKYAPTTRIKVFERDAHPHARPQGYTITINQRGMNALQRLDLSRAVEEHARQPLSFHVMRYNGSSLIRMPPQDKGPGRVFPVLRETLHDLLLSSLRKPESLIQWGSKVERYNIDQQDVNGNTEGPFDIVLGADGIRSVIRKQLIGDSLVSLGMVAFGGLSDSLIRDPLIASNSCFFLGRGASFFSVVTPDLSKVNFSFAFRTKLPRHADGFEPDFNALAGEMEKRLAAQQWYPPIVSIVKQELGAGRLRLRNIIDRQPLPVWRTQGVTLLGDAAHPMTPYRGQGANTAIADGVAFALMLAKCLNKDWRPALAEYEAAMRKVGNEAAAQSRSTAQFFHSDSTLGMLARDGMLKAVAASMRWSAYINKK